MSEVDLSKFSDEEILAGKGSVIPKTKKKLTNWKKEPTLEDLKRDLTESESSHSSFLGKLDRWNELYDAPKFGDETTTTSRISPKLIRKQVEWRSPALSEPFLSTQNLFDVKPLTHEDVPRAKQNSLILNRQFNTQLNKVPLVDSIIRRLAKDGTVVARTGWMFREATIMEEVTEFEYTEIPPEQQEQVGQEYQQYIEMQTSAPDSYSQLPEELQASVEMSQEQGMLLMAEAIGTQTQETTKTVVNKPTAEVCNIRNVYIDPTCNGDIDKAQFVIYSYESSLSDLRKEGNFTNLDSLKGADNTETLKHDSNSILTNFKFQDEARKKLVVYEYWGYMDIDDTGETRSFMASWVNGTIIRMEENPFPDGKPPFVVFNYIPEEDSIYGIPDAELLGDNQDISGAVTRGMIDIMGKSANGQRGFSKNFLDVTNAQKFKKGEDYAFNQGMDPRANMFMHTFNEIPNSAMQMLQMINNDTESISGIKAFGQDGLTAVNFGNTAVGVRGVLDAVSKREMSVLRRISEGFIRLGRKIMSMNSEFLSEEETVRVTNSEFVTIRRDDLAGDFDLTLTISTAEADDAKAQELAFMLQTMGDSMGHEVMQMILVEIATLRKMPDLAKTIESYAPEPDPMAEKMKEMELMRAEAEIGKINAEAAEAEARAAVYQAKVAVEQARAESLAGDAGLKALDFAEKDSGASHMKDLEKQDKINQGSIAAQEAKAAGQMAQMDKKHNSDLLQKLADAELGGADMGGVMPDEGLPAMDVNEVV